MLNLETRLQIKVLWAASWPALAIARYLGLPLDEVQALIDVFEGRNDAAIQSCDRCRTRH